MMAAAPGERPARRSLRARGEPLDYTAAALTRRLQESSADERVGPPCRRRPAGAAQQATALRAARLARGEARRRIWTLPQGTKAPPSLSERALAHVRLVIEAALRAGAPLVKHLHLAPKGELERFVEFVTSPASRFEDLTRRPLCDTCFQGWKVCRRAQNNYQYFRATGLEMKHTHEWPKHGFAFRGRGHCSYIFLRCLPTPWPLRECSAFIQAVRDAAK